MLDDTPISLRFLHHGQGSRVSKDPKELDLAASNSIVEAEALASM